MTKLIEGLPFIFIVALILLVEPSKEKKGVLFIFLAASLLSVWISPPLSLVLLTIWGAFQLCQDRSVSQLILLSSFLLAGGLSLIMPARVNVVLLAGAVGCHCWQLKTRTTIKILLLASGFELTMVVLFYLSETSWQEGLVLALLSLVMLLINQLLAFLFKETDMIFARSLDQIMANYIGEVNGLYQNIRGWRHDYHNHLQAMKVYLDKGQISDIRAYLAKLEDRLQEVDQLVKSGNTMLDAIVNSKLSIAMDREIQMNVKVFVGKQPLINDVDLCVILGNILDNAIEANEDIVTEKRLLRVYISILKQQLYISITNSRSIEQVIDKDYRSTKNDKRGLGVRRIDQLVAKYDGMINRQYEEEVFVTEVLLPLATISDR